MIFDFFVPRRHLPFWGKIPCQSLNFVCQTLGESRKFADPSYVFWEIIFAFQSSSKFDFFAKMWIGNVFTKFKNYERISFKKLLVPTLYEPTSQTYDFFSLDIFMNLTSLKGFEPKKNYFTFNGTGNARQRPIYLLGTVEAGSWKTEFWIILSSKWLLHIMSHINITWSENLLFM